MTTKLSKSDAREVHNLAIHLKLGNLESAQRGALSFIRSASSDAIQKKRIAALAEIGIVFANRAA